MDIESRAKELADAGIGIIPIHQHDPENGDKRPAINWKRIQTQHLTSAEINQWFTRDQYGIGVAMGATSNDLMLIELEGRGVNLLPTLTQNAQRIGANHLWRRMFGWSERTPSGGFHWYIFAPGNTSGNRKLARDKNDDVLAETRENGGYSVVAPLDGERYHHTGRGAWPLIPGGPATAGTFTPDELDTLLSVFRTIDEKPIDTTAPTSQPVYTPPAQRHPHSGITPGDDFEDKTSWTDILTPHGWTPVFTRGSETFWRRPGKNNGISASTGHTDDRDRLWVWSTSTSFQTETPYTKFGAYTLLEFNGDHTAAAKHLAAKGYGKQAEHPRDPVGLDKFIQQGSQPASTATPQTHSETGDPLTVTEPPIYTRTDDGNALRYADTYQGQLRYVPEKKAWAHWDGHKWNLENGDATAAEAARALARNLPTDDKADENHKRRSLSATSIRNMLNLAKTSRNMYTPITRFDANPYILNTPAGTINLRTGQLTPPSPNTLCLRSTQVAPEWGTPTPVWKDFIADTFAGEPDLAHYVQSFLGMAIIGEVREQVFAFFNGAGANGKSTLLNVIQRILGTGDTGYTIAVPANMFLAGADRRHPAEIAALQGVRLAATSEIEEGQNFAEARVKLLTGSDMISARFMGGNFFTFRPSHTIIMLSNHEPEVQSGGDAFWRRIKKVPFSNVVPISERDPELEAKLMNEAPGILAWIIDGTLAYLANGLTEPQAVKVATKVYANEQDTVQMFIDDMCELGNPNAQHMQVNVAKFRSEYETWCRQNAYEPVGAKTLTQRLRAHGVHSTKGGRGARFYAGIHIPDLMQSTFDNVLGGLE
jgi:putative DNA primase/helicase